MPGGTMAVLAEAAINLTATVAADAEMPETQYIPYHERPETYIVPILFFIIFVVGVLGNGTLVVVFLRHRAMRNVPNTYILSLALADLLVIVTCVPFTSIVYTVESWPWGEAVCKLSESTKDISIGVSVFTLTALSAERYCAIVNPLRKLQAKSLTVLTAILIWILASLFSLPAMLFSNVEQVALDNRTHILICTPFPDVPYKDIYKKVYVITKALVYYIIPLIIIACFYILMAKTLHASAKEMPGDLHGAQSVAQARARRHVARMVLIFVIVFFACFLPYHLFELWFHLHPTSLDDYDDYWHALRIVGFCLSFLNSCVNPIALYLVSGVFRQHFNRYLCCRKGRLVSRHGGTGGQSSAAIDNSFNSTYKRHDTSVYRKHSALARQNTQDTTVVALDTFCHKGDKVKIEDIVNAKNGRGS